MSLKETNLGGPAVSTDHQANSASTAASRETNLGKEPAEFHVPSLSMGSAYDRIFATMASLPAD